MRVKPLTCALMGLLLTACGGGGGGGPSSAIERQSPSLNFPGNTLQSGDVVIERAFPGLSFDRPLFLTGAPGDATRLYVAQQGGLIRVFDASDENSSSASTFLDLTDRTRANGEQGLLGLAFDPDYQSNGFVYVYYSANANPNLNAGDSVIARFTRDPGTAVADPSSEVELLRFAQPFSNHNGGSLAFGDDGMLYIASGDGGSGNDPQNNAQNLGNLLGKILRIAPDGSIPADNPFVGMAGARGEIWAYGLRNPFRISFDPPTGRLWVGDVGQGAQEEIDIVRSGGNYGWRVFEGTLSNINPMNLPASQFEAPVFTYGRNEGRSITGGRVYRGSAIPELDGRYIYGDFASGTVWALTESGGRASDNIAIGSVGGPSSFGEDLDGELLITVFDGSLQRLVPGQGSGGPPADEVPQTLSATGLFDDLATLAPAAGVVPYEPRAPFWSDGASKRRWIAVPGNLPIEFSAEGNWSFPLRTVTVKHFDITLEGGQTKRLETRVFVNQSSGWQGYTYRWRDDGSDADLLLNAETVTLDADDGMGGVRTQTYAFPSRSQCLECHTAAAGFVLGVRTAQLNRDLTYPSGIRANQLTALEQAGYFDVPIGDTSQLPALADPSDETADLAARARAYLETNCAQCHQPGGPTPTNMDLLAATPIGQTNTVNVPGTGTPVGGATVRIVPGNRETSLIWTRINTSVDAERMPPLSTHVVDAGGVDLIGQWIDEGAN